MKNSKLGKNFWLFRIGQTISVFGDPIASIALSWWILEKTNDPKYLSYIFIPGLIVKLILIPLLAPLGDLMPKNILITISDFIRALIMFTIAYTFFFMEFNIYILITLFTINSVFASLFESNAHAIIPEIVTSENMIPAMQHSMAIRTISTLGGGIIGGILISLTGVGVAFSVNALSFLVAAIFTLNVKIKNEKPQTNNKSFFKRDHFFTTWKKKVTDGIKITTSIPIIFMTTFIAMGVNFVMAPFSIILPVLIQDHFHLSAWHLGVLEGALGLGLTAGFWSVKKISQHILPHHLAPASLALAGLFVVILPYCNYFPLLAAVMFALGFSTTLNLPVGSNVSLATPNSYRSRIASINIFLRKLLNPLSFFIVGLLLSNISLEYLLTGMGLALIGISSLFFFIIDFKEFMTIAPSEVKDFFTANYKEVFTDEL